MSRTRNECREIQQVIMMDTYKLQKANQVIDESDIGKLEQAIVHGYVGASKKKHNGVVNIKPRGKDVADDILWKTLERVPFQPNNPTDPTLKLVAAVKLVAHCPSGNRTLGYLFNRSSITESETAAMELYLVCFGNYTHIVKG